MSNFNDKPTLDISVYQQLCKDLGDEDGSNGVIAGLMIDFREDAQRLITDLRHGFTQADARLFQRSAHTLKSNSAMFGALKLSAMCKEMEEMGKTDLFDGAAERIATLEIEFEKVLTALPIT